MARAGLSAMFKWLLIVGLLLSVLVLLVAALLSPADLVLLDPGHQPQDWCLMMEHKPNDQWQGDDFERFAKNCL